MGVYFLFVSLNFGFAVLADEFEFTQQDLESWRDEVRPLVEEFADAKFSNVKPLRVKVASEHEIYQVILKELLNEYGLNYPEVNIELLRPQLEAVAKKDSSRAYGKTDLTEGVFLINPDMIRKHANALGIPGEYRKSWAKCWIAHEMTHFLQDQVETGILSEVLQRIKNVDEKKALHSILEGQAVYVQEKVGARLGIPELYNKFSKQSYEQFSLSERRSADLQVLATEFLQEEPYLRGLDFVTWQIERHGPRRIWEILAAPPRETSVIYHPELYGQTRHPPATPTIDLNEALSVLIQADPGDWKSAGVIPVGEMIVRQGMIQWDPEVTNSALQGFQSLDIGIAHSPDGRPASIGHMHFSDPKDSIRYISHTIQQIPELLAHNPQVGIENQEVQLVNGQSGSLATQVNIDPSGCRTPVQSCIRAAHGTHVFEVSMPHTHDRVLEILKCVASHLLNAAASAPAHTQ